MKLLAVMPCAKIFTDAKEVPGSSLRQPSKPIFLEKLEQNKAT